MCCLYLAPEARKRACLRCWVRVVSNDQTKLPKNLLFCQERIGNTFQTDGKAFYREPLHIWEVFGMFGKFSHQNDPREHRTQQQTTSSKPTHHHSPASVASSASSRPSESALEEGTSMNSKVSSSNASPPSTPS